MRGPKETRAQPLGSARGVAAEALSAAAQAERFAQTKRVSPASWSWTDHPLGALQLEPARVDVDDPQIALGMGSGADREAFLPHSLAPWSGPDLPGSLASTLKYRLIVASAGDAAVTLHAAGLARDWVASFCADGLCSPQQVSFHAPPSGVNSLRRRSLGSGARSPTGIT